MGDWLIGLSGPRLERMNNHQAPITVIMIHGVPSMFKLRICPRLSRLTPHRSGPGYPYLTEELKPGVSAWV